MADVNMLWDKWKQDVIDTANSDFAFVIGREAKENDFKWKEFKVYYEQGLSAYEALESDLSRHLDNTKH